MTGDAIEIRIHEGLGGIDPAEWDACAAPEGAARPADPFTTYRFLRALELSGSVGPGTGWAPRPITAHRGGEMIAAAPLYVKSHSQGEYVFDHGWAQAWERAGGQYYPKLQIAVPFTPATGRRFLVKPGYEALGQAALVEGAVRLAAENGLSSLHVTFCTEEEAEAGEAMGLIHRVGTQYHWENAGYPDYETFLGSLSSRKRKTLRRERREAQDFGGEIVQLSGDALKPWHWDAFWAFYQDTGSRKWGSPYLTRAFFDLVQETMRDDVLLVFALREGRPIAGALNFIGRDTLFGRYWGQSEHHPFLHFELCYHQAIDFALDNSLTKVEAGAQGDHKLARGYLPVRTHSLHWIADERLRVAVEDFVAREAEAVDEDVEILTSLGPFRRRPGLTRAGSAHIFTPANMERRMTYTIDRSFPGASFDEIETRTREAIAGNGFGVLTEIDVQATMKKKLDEDMPGYKILGACNPKMAFKAIGTEPKVGAMLPCNVILREVDGGVEVSAVDPVASMMGIDNDALKEVAGTVREMMEKLVAAI